MYSEAVNHLLFMDDIKLYGKDEGKVNSAFDTVYNCNADIRMDFGMKIYSCIKLEEAENQMMDGLTILLEEIMKT